MHDRVMRGGSGTSFVAGVPMVAHGRAPGSSGAGRAALTSAKRAR